MDILNLFVDEAGHNWLFSPLLWLGVLMMGTIIHHSYHKVKIKLDHFVDYEDRKIQDESKQGGIF